MERTGEGWTTASLRVIGCRASIVLIGRSRMPCAGGWAAQATEGIFLNQLTERLTSAWHGTGTTSLQSSTLKGTTWGTMPCRHSINGDLALSGTLKNGAAVRHEDDLGHPGLLRPTTPLSDHRTTLPYLLLRRWRIGRVASSSTDWWMVLRTHQFSRDFEPCPNPYDVSPSAPPPQSPDEANQHHREAKVASELLPPETRRGVATIPWITAISWDVRGESFAARANIGNILNQYGPGVYTIVVWARLHG